MTGAMTSWAMRMPRVIVNGSLAEIDQEHLHLAAVVGVDRAGRVEHGDAVPEGEAGARPHLRLEAIRQLR